MNHATFSERLHSVSVLTREFALRYVRDPLPPESFRYFVRLNQSCDKKLQAGEHVFPDDVSRYGERVGPLEARAVMDLLCRAEGVPEWIDICVGGADAAHTYFELLCCGRFTRDETLLYYRSTAHAPFGSKSPVLPPRWTEAQGRVALDWRDHLPRPATPNPVLERTSSGLGVWSRLLRAFRARGRR